MEVLRPYQVYYDTENYYYLLILNEMDDYPGIYYCLNLDGSGGIFTSDSENLPENFKLVTGFYSYDEAYNWITHKDFIKNIINKIFIVLDDIEDYLIYNPLIELLFKNRKKRLIDFYDIGHDITSKYSLKI